MKVNFEMRTIEMTKKESKEAAKYGSDCYRELIEIKKDFPDFSVAIRELPRKRGVKNPTYQKMEAYVQKFGSDEQKKQFEDMRVMMKKLGGKGKKGIGRNLFGGKMPKGFM